MAPKTSHQQWAREKQQIRLNSHLEPDQAKTSYSLRKYCWLCFEGSQHPGFRQRCKHLATQNPKSSRLCCWCRWTRFRSKSLVADSFLECRCINCLSQVLPKIQSHWRLTNPYLHFCLCTSWKLMTEKHYRRYPDSRVKLNNFARCCSCSNKWRAKLK